MKYVLSLRWGPESTTMNVVGNSEIIEANSLVELTSKLLILIAKIAEERKLYLKKLVTDDIPF